MAFLSKLFDYSKRIYFIIIFLLNKHLLSKKIFFVGTFAQKIDGNAFYFAQYCNSRKDIKVFVNTRNDREIEKRKELNVVLRGSYQEFFLLRNADAVFTVGNLQSDFSALPGSGVKKMLFWHNIPLKAMGFQSKPVIDNVGEYDYIISTSPFASMLMKNAFATKKSQVIITGQPKTDPLFVKANNEKEQLLAQINCEVKNVKSIVSYLPTWRHDFSRVEMGDYAKDPTVINNIITSLINNVGFTKMLEDLNAIFVVKGHSYDYEDKFNKRHPRFISIGNDVEVESEQLMRVSDIVVSDYSGIVVDWLILAKPLVCYVFDLSEYWKMRGNPSFDYQGVFDELCVFNEDDFLLEIKSYLSNKDYKSEIINRISDVFHVFRDENSSKRVADFILKN